MNYYTSMNYSKEDFNRLLSKKITRKLITTTTVMIGLGIFNKVL